MGIDYSPKLIKDRAAQQCADLYLLSQDLEHAKECADRIIQTPMTRHDPLVSQALATSGFIAYRRCFRSGARFTLEPAHLRILSALELGKHRNVMNWADRMFVHAESDAVNGAVGVYVGVSKSGAQTLGGFWFGGRRLVFPPQDDVVALRDLADRIRNGIVEPRIAKAKSKLRVQIEALPIEEVASCEDALETTLPSSDETADRRKHNQP